MTSQTMASAEPRAWGIAFPWLVDRYGKKRPNPWVAISQNTLGEAARRTRWTLAPRMYQMALSRMDRHGHSMWAPGELRDSLAKLHPQTGELVDVDRSAVTKALQSLIDDELICRDSTVQCVRFAQADAQMAYGKDRVCRVHR